MSFGVYLAGTFETRLGIMTQLQVVNPTVNDLEIHVFFLRPDGTPVWDGRFEVESNGMWETDTIRLREEIGRIQAGVVKIFSLRDRRLKPGIVGWQRHAAAGGTPGDHLLRTQATNSVTASIAAAQSSISICSAGAPSMHRTRRPPTTGSPSATCNAAP